MSKYMVKYLSPYRKPDCKLGRITTTDDFKHLARKVSELHEFVPQYSGLKSTVKPQLSEQLRRVDFVWIAEG